MQSQVALIECLRHRIEVESIDAAMELSKDSNAGKPREVIEYWVVFTARREANLDEEAVRHLIEDSVRAAGLNPVMTWRPASRDSTWAVTGTALFR
jgi:predicted ATP-dependent protease